MALCKQCLAFEPGDRPADAGAVAEAVAALRAAADERARRAELEQVRVEGEQATAAARSAERRKRRRLALGAALAVVLALAVGTIVSYLKYLDAQQQKEIAQQQQARAEAEEKATANALGIVASQKTEVEKSLSKAEAAEEAGRKLLYMTDMQLAPFLWRDDRTTAEQLRVLLARHIPNERMKDEGGRMLKTENGSDSSFILDPSSFRKPDLRGFEWHYYQHVLEHSATVFSGHAVSVADGAFTSDGQLVTLDQNGQMRRWDLASQQEDARSRRDLPGGQGAPFRVLSPNGRLVALADGNKVHVFDTSTGKETFQIDSASTQYGRLIFSLDSDHLVVVDDKIRWLSAVNGQLIASVNQKFDHFYSLALSADGLTLAVLGHGDGVGRFSIFRLDATRRSVTPGATNIGYGVTLNGSALSPDGQRIALGNVGGGGLSVYDTATGRLLENRSAHASPITAIAFSGDGARLATADNEGTIKIWADAQKLTSKSAVLLTEKGHQGAINGLAFSSDGKRLVSASVDKTARVWDLENAGAAIRPLERAGSCLVARFSASGQLIATAAGSSLRLWDAATGQLVRQLSAGDAGRIHSVAFSPADDRLLAVGYGGAIDASYVALWDIDAGTELARLLGATDLPGFPADKNRRAVGALEFSPDGKYLVAGFGTKYWLISSPHPLKVWEVATRRLVRRLNGHTGCCVSLDFSRDGRLLASGSRDGSAIIWSTETWNRTQTLQNPDKDSLHWFSSERGTVEGVAFSPDGKTLALASREGNIHLWDVPTGELRESLKGHSGAVSAVAFSPDGRTLASGGWDQTVRLWNVATRRQLMQLDPGGVELGNVLSLAFSPDGQHLLAGGFPFGDGRGATAIWSAAPMVWNDPERAAEKLRLLLQSNADFRSRIRMLSENLRLHEALAKLDAQDARVQAALAATRANWHAAQQRWALAAKEVDRLLAVDPAGPEAWLRTPGLLHLATALVHQNRPAVAARLLQGGAERRREDGFAAISRSDRATDELLAALEKRLAEKPEGAGLRELRAELAGQWSGWRDQVADYSAAIKILADQPAEASSAPLRRLYRRRGDAYVNLQKWQEAVDDYAHVITPETTNALLLSNRARAHEGLKHCDAATADWSRAANGNPEGPKLLADFARRLAAGGHLTLAKGQFDKARALYEGSLETAPDSDFRATNLAQLLMDKHKNENRTRWTILQPVEAKSELGATLSVLPDDSILASGANPRNDRYRVVLTVPKKIDLAAVRLEALTHPSLPGNGPGRYPGRQGQFTGNFSQTSWQVTATPPDRKDPLTLEFDNALVDQQTQAPIKSNGEWNIYGGGEGRECTAIWSLSKPVSLAAGSSLTFAMQFAGEGPENLGHFRLSVTDLAGIEREQSYSVAMKLPDPWAKLAAAYHIIGDQQALDNLLERHPTAAAYQSAGRTREGVSYLAKASTANPDDTMLSMKVAALQAWFGQDKELAATRQRIRAFAKDTNDTGTAERAAKACSIRASSDKAELDATLALARKGVDLGKGGQWEWRLLALGMAEYRCGNDTAAVEALLAAAKAGSNNPSVTGVAAFYRAMSLFRQGKHDEACKLAIAAAAQMKPFPKDEQNPLANGADHDDLILWLAYKEAEALIKFDAALPLKAEKDKK